MKYRHLPGNGISFSNLALGTMGFGTETDETEAFSILDRFVEGNGNLGPIGLLGTARGDGSYSHDCAFIGHWDMTGDLTVRDVTRQVLLDVEFTGATVDPWGNLRSGFDASTRVDRDQFGITWNQALEAGGFLVGKEILVQIDVEAVHQKEG